MRAAEFEKAYDYDFEVKSFNQSQNAKIINIRKERLEREKRKKKAKETFLTFIKSVFFIVVFVSMLSLIIYKNSLVSEAKYDIFGLKSEIKSLNSKIEETSALIEQKTELKAVEKYAIEELNMQYPSKNQIVYIDASKTFALNEDATSQVALVENDESYNGVEKRGLEEMVYAFFSHGK